MLEAPDSITKLIKSELLQNFKNFSRKYLEVMYHK